MRLSIYYDSLKVSKSKCQFIWREWRGGNGGALLEASRGLRGLQMHIGDSEVWWQPLLSLWGSLEASKKVRRFRRAISATWFDTLILTLSKSHSRLTTSLTSNSTLSEHFLIISNLTLLKVTQIVSLLKNFRSLWKTPILVSSSTLFMNFKKIKKQHFWKLQKIRIL